MLMWTELEVLRWTRALDFAGSEAESAEEADFYRLWEDDVENSPPPNVYFTD